MNIQEKLKRIFKALIIVGLLIGPSFLFAQDLDSLDAIKTYAISHSLSYRKAMWEVQKAKNNLDGILTLDETEISSSLELEDDSESEFSTTLDVPIFDQLSINSSISTDYSASLGFKFNPLIHDDNREQLKINLQKTLAYAEEEAIKVENQALEVTLEWMSIKKNVDIQSKKVGVKENLYLDERIRYKAGESDLDDVRDLLINWTEERKILTTLENSLRSQEALLLSALSSNLDNNMIKLISIKDLELELEKIKEVLDLKKCNSGKVYSVRNAYLDIQSTEKELKSTWLFDPTFSVEGNFNIDDFSENSESFDGENLGWNLTFKLGFSLDDWNKQDRDELKADLVFDKEEAIQIEKESSFQLAQAALSLQSTQQTREIAELEREENKELLDEAVYLQNLGKYSLAQKDDMQLDYDQSEADLFKAMVDEYLAWREIMLF